MSNFLTPPTSATLRCDRRQPGLLGGGQQGFAGETAMSFYMRPPNLAGQYAVETYTAALLLVSQLSSPDEDMSSAEAETSALLLRELLNELESAKDVSVDALRALQKTAQEIPTIGPLMFSPGNIPGTIASASGLVMAAAKTKKLSDVLDLTSAQRTKLRRWANRKGGPKLNEAGKVLKGRIKVIRKAGQLVLEIPLTLDSKDYKIFGEIGKSKVSIPAGAARSSLNKRLYLHADAARGPLKLVTSGTVGFALAVGPQAYLDWTSSTTKEEFYKKSAQSQPTNVVSFVAGAIVTTFLGFAGAPLVLVIAVGWGVGLYAQHAMSKYGLDKEAEDYFLK